MARSFDDFRQRFIDLHTGITKVVVLGEEHIIELTEKHLEEYKTDIVDWYYKKDRVLGELVALILGDINE